MIKQLLAGMLLLVFSFSITPKKYLHDAIANHRDKMVVCSRGNEQQLSNTGFACKCDNLVAESPFTDEAVGFDFAIVQVFSVQKNTQLPHFYISPCFFFELRGPPASNTLMI